MCCNSHRYNKNIDALVERARVAREVRNARRLVLYAQAKAEQAMTTAVSGYSAVFATNGTITGTTVEATKERDLVLA
jgi:hypothetical protein